MVANDLPDPTLHFTNQEARRFILAHQGLWPPRKLKGKEGILELINRLGCIQYDTINIVGRNADLVLQSRISNYTPDLLSELLYEDRRLIDGSDKVASIYPINDWPYFQRRRDDVPVYYSKRSKEALEAAPNILETIRERGPLSSLDFKDDKKTDWHWAPTSLSRAAMELLHSWGKLGVHHKVNTRRAFDVIERLVPSGILSQEDPNKTDEEYHDWHVLRRVGGLGYASSSAGEHWLGIWRAKSPERKAALRRLVDEGKVTAVSVEGVENQTLFIRSCDLVTLESTKTKSTPKAKAAFIAPLDNLIWHRKLIKDLFNFEYVWEVYKPKKTRQYGYYVLPVLYGDRFVARVDPAFDKKKRILTITNWWWEEGIKPDDAMMKAVSKCLVKFSNYLKASSIKLGDGIAQDQVMQKIILA